MDPKIEKELKEHAAKYQNEMRLYEKDSAKLAAANTEFSNYITGKLGEMIAAGASPKDIADVQTIMQNAFTQVLDHVPRDATDFEADDIEDIINMVSFYVFSEVEPDVITNFESGKISRKELIDAISKDPYQILGEAVESIDLILNNYDADDSILLTGEMLAGEDGEVVILDELNLEIDEIVGVMSEPVVYQTLEDVRSICKILSGLSKDDMKKKFNFRKLVKSDMLWRFGDDLDEETFRNAILGDFDDISKMYKNAAEKGRSIVLLIKYAEDE